MSGDLSSGSISWGPEIAVYGWRPQWLKEGRTRVLKHHSRYAEGWQELPADEVNWETADMIRLPASDSYYAKKAEAPAIDWNGPLEVYRPDGRTQEVTKAYPSGSPNSDHVLTFSRPPATDCPYGFQANGSPYVGSKSEWRVRNRVVVEEVRPTLTDSWFVHSAAYEGVKLIRPETPDALAQANAKIRKLKRKLRKARATTDRNAAFADSKIDELADKLAEARTYTPEQAEAARAEFWARVNQGASAQDLVASLAVKLGLRKAPSAAQEN